MLACSEMLWCRLAAQQHPAVVCGKCWPHLFYISRPVRNRNLTLHEMRNLIPFEHNFCLKPENYKLLCLLVEKEKWSVDLYVSTQ